VGGERWMRWAACGREQARMNRTIGCATRGTRLCRVLRCVRTTRAFRARYAPAAWSTVLGEGEEGGGEVCVQGSVLDIHGWRKTLRMCTSVAGQMTLILTSGLSSEWLSQPSIHVYWK
jgi:hypothetical protein